MKKALAVLLGGLILLTGCNDKAEVQPADTNDHVRVYPNPANQMISIEVTHKHNSPFLLKVFDSKGDLLLEEQGIQGRKTFRLELSGKPKGKYQVILKTDVSVSTQTFLKI